MSRKYYLVGLPVIVLAGWVMAQPSGDPLIEGFRTTEVAAVADATEQLYGQRSYMSHDMRPLFKTKVAGPRRNRPPEEGGTQGGFGGFPGNDGRNRCRPAGIGVRHGG